MRSKLRNDNVEEIQTLGSELGRAFVMILENMGHDKIFRSCANCQNWQEGQGCSVFRQLPPVSVIVTGCDQHKDTYVIPF
jgi:hypothetical protein